MTTDIITRLRAAIAALNTTTAYALARSDYDLASSPDNITALLDRLDAAERENERLHAIVGKKFLDSTVIRELSVRNGGLDMQVEGGPCMLFADAFADFLVESGAENYVEVSFTSEKRPDIGKIVVTVQRLSGKTAHALRREAERENERLREALLPFVDEGIELNCDECGGDQNKCNASCVVRKGRAVLDAAMAAEQSDERREG